jgi:hypothetical protein
LSCAGASPGIFLTKAVESVHHFSAGIPRLINVICDNAMISAYALEKREIEARMIHEVAEDLCLLNGAAMPAPVRRDPPATAEVREPTRAAIAKPSVAQQPVREIRGPTKPESVNGNISNPTVPESFLVSLREALIDVMGPMGKIILSEQVKHFGASMERFPRDKVSNLIESLSREIFDPSSRDRFRKGISDGVRILQ